jgi:hypothetical protein
MSMGKMMDPAFENKEKPEIKEARLQLEGKLLLAFCGQEIIGQCGALHPEAKRHFDQIERIHGYKIINKEWMLREVALIGEYQGESIDQETKGGSGVDQQAASG